MNIVEIPMKMLKNVESPVNVIARGLITIALATVMLVGWFQTPALALPGLTQEEARKLDPLLSISLEPLLDPDAPRTAAPASALSPLARAAGVRLQEGVAVVDLLIRVRGGDTRALADLGLSVDAIVDEVATARGVPLARLPDLARQSAVASVARAGQLRTMNDASVPETQAPLVWDEFGVTGSGVLVGIIDTGIDPDHPDFKDETGATRIKMLLDLSQTGDGPFGGRLYTEAEINAGVNSRDPVGHGSHVAGTAAGSGRADPAFRGVAPGADLIIVNADRAGNGTFSTVDIVNALAFIDQEASRLGQPYVANLSLGGHNGAHDGSELEEVAIDALVGPGKPGRAIIVAAGNEQNTQRHSAGDVGSGGLELRVQVPAYDPEPGVGNDLALINIWYEASSSFAISVVTPGGETVGPFVPGQSNGAAGTATDNGLVVVENAIDGASPQNGDFLASILLIDAAIPPTAGTWTIAIAGDTGHFDAYVASSTIDDLRFANLIDPNGFIAEPGTARNAITVGAYMTKTQWIDSDLNPHDLRDFGMELEFGEAAPFSSSGPTRDGRLKPEISAPGAEIASAYSSAAPPESPVSAYQTPLAQFPNFFLLPGDPTRYAIQQGTSQATPHVAGAVALLFERYPDWDILDVKAFLTSNARADQFTGEVPNALFGYGKLDILAAMRAADGQTLPRGDVDGNGTTELADAMLAIDFVLGTDSPTPEEERRADVNSDHRLDVGDLVLIMEEVIGTPGEIRGTGTAAVETWTISIALDALEPVTGLELELTGASPLLTPRPDAIRATRDEVLVLGASSGSGSIHIIALALDGGDLAGEEPALTVPFDVPAGVEGSDAGWLASSVRLLGRGAREIEGTAILGSPERSAPATLRILPVVPNPAASVASITFDLPGPAARRVEAGIYDVTGRLVAVLADRAMSPGRHELAWSGSATNGQSLGSGVYWVRVSAGDETAVTRLTLLR